MNDDIIDDYIAFVENASKNELKDYTNKLIYNSKNNDKIVSYI